MGRAFTPSGGAGTPFEGQEILAGFLCPPLQASVNDYAVAARGFANASVLYIGATAPLNVTGLTGATRNRELTVVNVTAEAITLKNASGASAAANRFNFDADIVLNQWDGVRLIGAPPGAQGWVSAGGGGGGAPPVTASGAYVYATANNVIPGGGSTAINFDTVLFDTDSYFDAGTPNVLTVPAAGIYQVNACVLWAASAAVTQELVLSLTTNGNLALSFGYRSDLVPTAIELGQNISHALSLAAGDTVSATVFQNTGGNLDVTGVERITSMSIARIH
jgi:hypothetical protein